MPSDDRNLTRRRFALATYIVTLAFAGVALVIERLNPPVGQPLAESLGLVTGFVGFATVGVVVAVRRPEHRVGWLFLGVGLLAFSGSAAMGYAHYGLLTRPGAVPFAHLAAWYQGWFWFALLGVVGLAVLHFPDGRPPTPRWRLLSWLLVAGIAVIAVNVALAPEFVIGQTGWGLRASNPYGLQGSGDLVGAVEGVVLAVLGPALIVALVSVVVRHRRADGRERDQLRWVAYGTVVTLVGFVLLDHVPTVPVLVDVFGGVLFVIIPVTAGVAIVRHRLYDIDRVISRTVTYALLTALLAGTYAVGVVGLGSLARAFGVGGGADLVVATSTLAVAALFGPVRRRLQSLVDRRFNRSRYDSQQVVDAFAQRLRDEVHLEALTDDLHRVVAATVHPSSVGVWLLAEDRR